MRWLSDTALCICDIQWARQTQCDTHTLRSSVLASLATLANARGNMRVVRKDDKLARHSLHSNTGSCTSAVLDPVVMPSAADVVCPACCGPFGKNQQMPSCICFIEITSCR